VRLFDRGLAVMEQCRLREVIGEVLGLAAQRLASPRLASPDSLIEMLLPQRFADRRQRGV